MIYKDGKNSLYDDMDGKAAHLLPSDCVQISEEEAQAIRDAETPQQAIKTPQEADSQVSPRITHVTMRQARLALLGAGKLPAVNAAIAAMQGAKGEAARIEWEYSQEVQRDRGLVTALGSQMGMTEKELDALFTAAAAIP